MALLTYDVAVIGTKNVDTALDSLEKKYGKHNDRVSKQLSRAPKVPAAQDPNKIALASQKKLAREVQAEEKRAAREADRQLAYWSKARQQANLRNVKQEEIAQKRLHANAQRERQLQERFVRSTVGNTASRVWSGTKAVGTAAAATVGLGGAALAGAAVSQATKLDDISRRLSIQGRAPGEAGVDPLKLSKQFTQTGIETGLAPENVAAGAAAYVGKTGDLTSAIAQMKVFGTVAQATGANIEDIASAAADLKKLGVTSIDEVSKSLTILAMQGKNGAFEIKNMAQFLPAVLSAAASSNVQGVEGMKGIGGLLQVTQNTTGDAAETATGTINMFAELKKNAHKMHSGEAYGGRKVDVFEGGDAKNAMRPLRAILGDTMIASQFNSSQVQHSFGLRGIKPLEGMFTAGKQARLAALKAGDSDKVATEKGKDAGLAVWDKASNVSTNYKEIQRDASDAMKGFGVQMEELNTQLKAAVASELFPELVKMAPDLKAMVPVVRDATRAFVSLTKFLMANPFVGIGGAIAASIAVDIGKAKIGSVFSNGLKRMFGTGGNAPPTGGLMGKTIPRTGGTTVGGALGAAATGVALGATIATAIFTAGVVNFENAEVNMKEAGKNLNDVRGAGLEDVDAVRKAVNEQRKKVNDLNAPGIGSAFGLPSLDNVFNPAHDVEKKTQENFLAEMEKRLNGLEALKEGAEAMKKAGVSQEEAARRISEAATKMGITLPNRGNSPSPVK